MTAHQHYLALIREQIAKSKALVAAWRRERDRVSPAPPEPSQKV